MLRLAPNPDVQITALSGAQAEAHHQGCPSLRRHDAARFMVPLPFPPLRVPVPKALHATEPQGFCCKAAALSTRLILSGSQ